MVRLRAQASNYHAHHRPATKRGFVAIPTGDLHERRFKIVGAALQICRDI